MPGFELTKEKNVKKIREWLKGKKTYITAAIGLLTAVAAWSSGEITTVALVGAAWVAVQACFIRAGVRKSGGIGADNG